MGNTAASILLQFRPSENSLFPGLRDISQSLFSFAASFLLPNAYFQASVLSSSKNGIWVCYLFPQDGLRTKMCSGRLGAAFIRPSSHLVKMSEAPGVTAPTQAPPACLFPSTVAFTGSQEVFLEIH